VANPQAEDGHIDIANEIAEALMKINLSAYESRVLWFLFRKTYGWKKKTDRIALSQFAKDIDLDRRLIHRAIKGLSSKKMIVIYKDDTFNVSYGFQKDYDKWIPSSKKMTVINRDDALSSKEMMKLSSKEIPTKDTIQKTLIQKKEYSEDFLKFYSAYPNKKDKTEAWKRWKNLNGTRPTIEVLLEAIRKQIEWRENAHGNFRPEWKHPATWLSKGSWDDELLETKNHKRGLIEI
jgi:phage replication O-like protein O